MTTPHPTTPYPPLPARPACLRAFLLANCMLLFLPSFKSTCTLPALSYCPSEYKFFCLFFGVLSACCVYYAVCLSALSDCLTECLTFCFLGCSVCLLSLPALSVYSVACLTGVTREKYSPRLIYPGVKLTYAELYFP